jgi:hypothetical protein
MLWCYHIEPPYAELAFHPMRVSRRLVRGFAELAEECEGGLITCFEVCLVGEEGTKASVRFAQDRLRHAGTKWDERRLPILKFVLLGGMASIRSLRVGVEGKRRACRGRRAQIAPPAGRT